MHVKKNPRWQPGGHIEFLTSLKFDRLDAKTMGFSQLFAIWHFDTTWCSENHKTGTVTRMDI